MLRSEYDVDFHVKNFEVANALLGVDHVLVAIDRLGLINRNSSVPHRIIPINNEIFYGLIKDGV